MAKDSDLRRLLRLEGIQNNITRQKTIGSEISKEFVEILKNQNAEKVK